MNNLTREMVDEEVPIFSIKFLGGGAERIYGGTRSEDCTTDSHTRVKGLGEELPGDKEGAWVVMAQPEPSLTASNFLHPNLGSLTMEKSPGFKGIPTERHTLRRWESIFQELK